MLESEYATVRPNPAAPARLCPEPPAAEPAVLFPRGGELVGPGEEVLVRWRHISDTDCPTAVDLLVPGQPPVPLARVTSHRQRLEHSCLFPVPHGVWTHHAQLRISIFDGGAGCIATSNYFSVWDLFKVQVLSPAAGEVLRQGQQATARWQRSGVAPTSYLVKLIDGGSALIVARLPGAAEQCTWIVPDLLTERACLQVVAQDAQGREGYYQSGPFAITSGPLQVRLLPLSSSLLWPGQQVQLRWEHSGGRPPSALTLQVLLGEQVLEQVELPAGCAEFTWTVPDVRADPCHLQLIAQGAGGGVTSYQSEPLSVTILGRDLAVKVLAPLDRVFHVGQQTAVEWQASGGVPPFSATVYLRANGDCECIARDVTDSYAYWTVPNRSTSLARLQVVVRDAIGREASNLSDDYFTIEGFTVRVAYPNGREFMKAEQKVQITWESIGPVAHFAINLVIDGKVAEYIARGLPGTARSYDWIVPYMPTGRAHIRVIAHDELGRPMAEDDSDGYFSISEERPVRVTVLHPDGSAHGDQVFHLGETVRVTWKVEGCGNPVAFKVDLVEVDEAGRRLFPIAAAVPGTERSCDWVITGVPPSDLARVLVEAVDERGFHDLDDSDYYFKIVDGSLAGPAASS